jgi:hypothetical protein
MRKTALLIAGAIAFDLGVVVVSSHAAADGFLKLDGIKSDKVTAGASGHKAEVALQDFHFVKFDAANTPQSCMTDGGKTTTQSGVTGCLLPGKLTARKAGEHPDRQ